MQPVYSLETFLQFLFLTCNAVHFPFAYVVNGA